MEKIESIDLSLRVHAELLTTRISGNISNLCNTGTSASNLPRKSLFHRSSHGFLPTQGCCCVFFGYFRLKCKLTRSPLLSMWFFVYRVCVSMEFCLYVTLKCLQFFRDIQFKSILEFACEYNLLLLNFRQC